jgi:hypothetical protein
MSSVQAHKKTLANAGAILQLARKLGVTPVIIKGGKKYRLVAVNSSELDADNLPVHLKKRLTNLNK